MAGEQINPNLDPTDLRGDRIEWCGGAADVRSVGLLRPLLKQRVVRVERAGLIAPVEWESGSHIFVDDSSIVFTLEDGQRWELMDGQESDTRALIFKQIHNDSDLVTAGDLSAEPEEQRVTYPLEVVDPQPPWTIGGITELWSTHSTHPFLLGLVLWSDYGYRGSYPRTSMLAIYATIDELRVTTSAELWASVLANSFIVGPILSNSYDV